MATFWSKLTGLDENRLTETGRKIEIKKIKRKEPQKKINQATKLEETKEQEQSWLPQVSEGKLSVDVYLEEKNVVVISAIAGVKPADIEIVVDKDILTIKGKREKEKDADKRNYLHQECFWGSFSRTILLPSEVKTDTIKANFKNGILSIILPIKNGIDDKVKISPKTNIRK